MTPKQTARCRPNSGLRGADGGSSNSTLVNAQTHAMNPRRPTLILFTTIAALATLQADGAKRAANGCGTTGNRPAAAAGRPAKVTITGSLIPVDAKDARHTASRASGSVVVLTGKDLQRIGAVDLADALRRGIATGR